MPPNKPRGKTAVTTPPPVANSRERFINAARCLPVDRPPVWLMRQAGRALPEYRELKSKYTFLELVQTPDLAAEVTLQPVRRFGFDAAILFSDILVVCEALGQRYHFRETGGIEMEFTIRGEADFAKLKPGNIRAGLDYMARALQLIKRELAGQTALIGFAGAPWTLANFMLEGGSSKDFTGALALLKSDPGLFEKLMELLTDSVAECLKLQIDAGADVVQIFDSLGGLLPGDLLEAASTKWIGKIIELLGGRVPVIVFSKGANGNWDALLRTRPSVLGVDWEMPLPQLRKILPPNVGIQGNLDPALLMASIEEVERGTRRVLEEMRGRDGHIFNLGHGVPPGAKLENIGALVQCVKEFK
jgi:uroporphyrinogen decarboxylase